VAISHNSALDRRQAGVLLHATSLPGDGPCGTLGAQAHRFVDWLADAGLRVWQLLPVGPTQADLSPYQSPSAHAGNPRLVDLAQLAHEGWLSAAALPARDDAAHDAALKLAGRAFRQGGGEGSAAFRSFCNQQAYWLEDYVLFQALHDHHRSGWWQWPAALRDREPPALDAARQELADELAQYRFEQFTFFTQWMEIKRHANGRGVLLFGDVPIFVAHDSAEVWANPQDFLLDATGDTRVVAGVPPDYFSETGQRWGNPLYDWQALAGDGFRFWIERLRTQLALFDLVRIDHFRGFEAYWEIPSDEPTAIHGRWVSAPGDALFERLHEVFGALPLVAEDLGIITEDVEALRDRYGLPGMKILQFAFDGSPENPYLPARHPENAVVYTGTHDNDTTVGWWQGLNAEEQARVAEILGGLNEDMPWPLVQAALDSRAHLTVLPMQDLLGLGSEHRMNVPGTSEGNWRWRLEWDWVAPGLATDLHRRIAAAGRLG
jgi:4-alpha-glucanotransferase